MLPKNLTKIDMLMIGVSMTVESLAFMWAMRKWIFS